MPTPTGIGLRGTGPGRRRLLQAGALAAGGWLLGCADREPVCLGFLGGLSGRVADLGIGGRNGVQLAVEQFNERGGLQGRKVELLIEDDEQSDETARLGLMRLFDAGAVAVIGPMTSSIALAVVPLANERGVPLVSPTVTTHDLSGKADMFFRVAPDAPTSARQQIRYVHGLGARTLVTLADLKNRAFAHSWAHAAAQQFVADGGVLLEAIDFEAAPGLRFADLARKVVDRRPDAVLIVASAADTALLVQQIRQQGLEAVLALSAWAGTEQLPQMGGRAVDGAIVVQYFDRDNQAEAFRDFVALYRKRFGEAPGFQAVDAFDAMTWVLAALVAGGPSAAGIAKALQASRQHAGLQQVIPIDAFGDSAAPTFLAVVKDGAYVSLP